MAATDALNDRQFQVGINAPAAVRQSFQLAGGYLKDARAYRLAGDRKRAASALQSARANRQTGQSILQRNRLSPRLP